MDSSSSTLVALNNDNHRFWNFSKAGQSVSDVSGLPKKIKLQFHLPSRVTFLSTSGVLAKVFFVQDIGLRLNWSLTQPFWLLFHKEESRKVGSIVDSTQFHFFLSLRNIISCGESIEFKFHFKNCTEGNLSHQRKTCYLGSCLFEITWSMFS